MRADVVLVPVRDEDARDAIRYASSAAKSGGRRRRPSPRSSKVTPQSTTQRLAALLEGQAVHADLAEAAEGEDAQRAPSRA